MRGGGINTTTSRQTRDYRGGGKSDSDGNADGECRTPPSWDLAATALVLAAEAAATLIADDADDGKNGVAIIDPSRRVSWGWGGSKHKRCAARPATGSTMVVLKKSSIGGKQYLDYL